MQTNSDQPETPDSPPWDKSTKRLVISAAFILLGLTMWQFKNLIGILIMAAIIAYILNAPILWLKTQTSLSRGHAVGVIYSVFALIVLGLIVMAGVTLFNQGQALADNIQLIIHEGPTKFDAFMKRTLHFGDLSITPGEYSVEIQKILEEAWKAMQGMLGTGATFAGNAAATTATWLGHAVFVYVISIYFAIELPGMANAIADTIYQPSYRRDLKRLLDEMGLVWHSYLRGQTTLALIMATITTVGLSLLGVSNALALGILTGVLGFIPFLGPGIAIGLAVLVAIFQDGNWLGLSPLWFGALVLGFGLILQQVEGNWLNPRIVGGALGLHPLLVIIGTIMGATIMGLIGIMLAAPVIATVKLFGIYAWRKLSDRPAFPPLE